MFCTDDTLWQQPDAKKKSDIQAEIVLESELQKVDINKSVENKLYYLTNRALYYAQPDQPDVLRGMAILEWITVEFI